MKVRVSHFCVYELSNDPADVNTWYYITETKYTMKRNQHEFEELSKGVKVIHVTWPETAYRETARKYLQLTEEMDEYRVRGLYWNSVRGRYERPRNPKKWDFKETKEVIGRKGKTTKKINLSTREKGYLKAHKNDKERQEKLYKRVIIVEHPLGDGPVTGKPRILYTYKSPYDRPVPDRKKIKNIINAGKLLDI